MSESSFTIRIRIGNQEVEIRGNREEALKALDDLPAIVEKVVKAFEGVSPATHPTPVVSAARIKEPTDELGYPSISSKSSGEAISELLSSEWGKKPRALSEISKALEANALYFPASTLGKSLQRLVNRGKLRRWKTETGYVYVVA